MYIPKGAYWKVITIQIGYTKKYLLKGHNPSYWIYIKGAYWMIRCLLNEKVPIEWKGWMKRCLLNENISIGRKCVYWIKMCLLKSYNPLGIHSDWYSFGNLFSTSSLSSFLEIKEKYESSAKLLFVNLFFFFFVK